MAGIKTNKDFAVYVENIVEQDPGFKASATLDFQNTNPTNGNYLTLNGTKFTFVDSTANATDVLIGSDISATLDNLLANTNLPDSATYTKIDTDKLFIEYKTIGDSGNNYTIDCDFVSLPTSLSGGSDVPDLDWVQFDASINFKTIELLLDSSTNDSTLCSYNYPIMKEGNKLFLIDSVNNVIETTLGTITESGTLQTFDPNHIGSRISLDSTYNIATRNSDSNDNVNAQVYGYGIDKGNVYWEIIYLENELYPLVGVSTDNTYQDNFFAYPTSGYGYNYDAKKYNNGTGVSYGDTFGLNDVLGVRYCYETGELEFYKNGISQGIAYTLTANTIVYPAISTAAPNAKAQMISDAKDMKYLPDDCVPYGMLKYSTDISGLGLTKIPIKAFLDNKPLFLASMEPSKDRIISNIVEKDKIIFPSSTKDELHTGSVYEGEELLIDGNNVQIDVTKLTIVDTVSDPDPLEDGSQVAGYTFDNDVESGGNVICMNDSTYNGQWKDSGGNNVNGVYTTGKFGNAANFDGSHYIVNSNLFSQIPDQFSFSYWLNASTNNVGITELKDSSETNHHFEFFIDSNGILNFYYFDGNAYIVAIKLIELNSWYFLTCVSDTKNKVIDIYINNINVKKINYNGTLLISETDFVVGKDYSTGKFNGLIDQVRIFNRVLTPEEISLLYKEQKVKYDISDLNLPATPSQVISKGYVDLVKDTSDTSSFTGLSPYVITIDSTDNLITDKGFLKPTGAITVDAVSTVDNANPLFDDSQVAAYQFEDIESGGNVTDMNGNYNGQWYTLDSNGNPVTCDGVYTTGKFGNAASFDGSHYIETPKPLTDTSTVSVWVNLQGIDISSIDERIWNAKLNPTDDSTNTGLSVYNGYLEFYVNTKDVVKFKINSDNLWHHIVCDIENKILYFDGNFIDEINEIEIRGSADTNFTIGALAYRNMQYFNGLIDQVRIFNRPLDSLEVQALYNEQIQKYTIPLDSSSNAYEFCKIPQRTLSSKVSEVTFNGSELTATYDIIKKQGRYIQRRIALLDNYIEVIPPFKSNMWKVGQ